LPFKCDLQRYTAATAELSSSVAAVDAAKKAAEGASEGGKAYITHLQRQRVYASAQLF
jgi:hypothetical protein